MHDGSVCRRLQQGHQDLHDAVHGAAVLGHHRLSAAPGGCAQVGIGEQDQEPGQKLVRIIDDPRSLGSGKKTIHGGEIEDMRAGDDGDPKGGGLEGIVTARGYQAAAHEGHLRKRVE